MLLTLPLVYPYFRWIYVAGVGTIALLLVYEHRLVRPNDLRRVNRAFFYMNALVSLGLLAIGAVELYWH